MNLQEKFPKLLSDNSRWSTYSIPPGWLSIVEELCGDIQHSIDSRGLRQINVVQIKEKFGGLRFYVDYQDEVIEKMILRAESACSRTCSVCGKPGEMSKNGWLQVFCEEHDIKESNYD